jgi:hypothetical protein
MNPKVKLEGRHPCPCRYAIVYIFFCKIYDMDGVAGPKGVARIFRSRADGKVHYELEPAIQGLPAEGGCMHYVGRAIRSAADRNYGFFYIKASDSGLTEEEKDKALTEQDYSFLKEKFFLPERHGAKPPEKQESRK